MKRTSIFLVVACVLCVAGCDKTTPTSPSLNFMEANGSNAFAYVTGLVENCTPRDAMTPGAERAATWIQTQLTSLGVNAEIDRFIDDTPNGQQNFFNVTALLPATAKASATVVLLSHFDTKSGINENFQGANDSGSSTGLLIELARMIKENGYPLNILVAFLDGEECHESYDRSDGLHGSRHLAAKLKRAKVNVKAVILTDMIGDRDLNIVVPHNGTGWLRALALKAADATDNRAYISLTDGRILDDHQPFLDLGFPAVDLIDFNYGSTPGANDYWHTPQDTLDKISSGSLTITGRIVAEMLNIIAREQ